MPIANSFLRLWGVRHVRAMILCYKINRHYDAWAAAGFIGGWTSEEIAYWQAIKAGRA